MTKAVIFDLDGTLIDSEPIWREADFKLANKYNFPLTDEFRKKLTGRGIKECAELIKKEYQLDISAELINRERLKIMYEILFNNLTLMPYAEELIKKLKDQGRILAVATAGHDVETTNKILEKLSIAEYFTSVVSGLEVKKSKPAPDIFIDTAKRLKVSPEECIVVEDAVNGVVAAKAAGCKVIGVNKDKEFQEKFKQQKADFIFNNLNIPVEIFS